MNNSAGTAPTKKATHDSVSSRSFGVSDAEPRDEGGNDPAAFPVILGPHTPVDRL
jgi:hypothetical protein